MRGMTPDVSDAVTAEVVRRALAVRLEFDTASSFITTLPFDITIDDETYVGVGKFGQISAVEESGDLASYSLTMELSAIPRDIIAVAFEEPYQSRPAYVWEVLLDEDERVIADPILVFRGRMDVMTIALGETATVRLECTNRLADWERPKMTRYSDEDQQRLHPGDFGCQYAAQMETKEITWPAAAWFKKHAQ